MRIKTKIISAACAAAACAAAAAADLNIWNWSDYIGENTVADFQKESGLKNVNYATFDSNEMVEARLLSGHSGFDCVNTPSYYVPRLAKAGAIVKIDHSKIPHWNDLDQVRMKKLAEIDPNNDFAYPYTEISVGIGYNVKKVQEIFGKDYKVDSWNFLFDKNNSAKLRECGLAVIDSPIEVISAAMHFLGKDPSSEKAADYKEARALLTDLARNTAYFHSSRYINDLASGEVCAVIGYSGDVLQSRARAQAAGQGIEVQYVVPKEGSPMWFDCWAVPAAGDHYDAAMKWFDYLINPDHAADIANEIRYPLPVSKAVEHFDPELRDNPSIILSDELMAKMYLMQPTSAKVSRITNDVWNGMKLDSGASSGEDGEAESEDANGWD
ncbi:MAG: polyamine ABC transporter substrate-binding protein [Succinivibrio sp.]|nr:polyamine ABC transporter substrate-binding protein [Succinivibrio sp.]